MYPGAHDVHVDEEAAPICEENVPAGQGVQDDIPIVEEKVPAAHLGQEVEPVEDVNEPTGDN
jgi:hypothetical protein